MRKSRLDDRRRGLMEDSLSNYQKKAKEIMDDIEEGLVARRGLKTTVCNISIAPNLTT